MWFQFPEGVERLSMELQEYITEAKDPEGRGYFRAPDHYAPLILDLPGFKTAKPPEGAPADLPKADPLRDGAIGDLTRQVDSLKLENENLRANTAELRAANDDLKLKLHETTTELGNLQAEVSEAADAKAPKK